MILTRSRLPVLGYQTGGCCWMLVVAMKFIVYLILPRVLIFRKIIEYKGDQLNYLCFCWGFY